MAAAFTIVGSTVGVCNTTQPFRVYLLETYVPPGDGLWPMPGVQLVTALPTA